MAVDQNESSFHEAGSKSSLHDLDISILGTSFSITADKDSQYLNEVLEQYRLAVTSTQAISGVKDPLRVAILTGFLLCDQINELKLQVEAEQAEAVRALNHTQTLVMHLDKAIERSHSNNG